MRVGVLGPLEVQADDGTAVVVGGARLRGLVVRLALDAGRPVTVTALADALWDKAPPTDRANAVHSLVSRLRRSLPPGSLTRSGSGGYRLDVPADAVDALLFERLAEQGRRALRAGDPATAVGRLRQALGLWRGQALADVLDAGYAAAPAARLEELRLAAVEDRVEASLRMGGHGQVIAELVELTAAHPLRERLHELLVKALCADGRQAEALSAYERLRGRLADELGVDPSPQLQAFYVAVLRGELTLPPTPVRAGTPGNVPEPLSSFIGRREELQQAGRLLRVGRLVTLVGPGGAGKTRLATTLVQTLGDDMPGGVWLVELARVSDPEDIPGAVIGALGLRDAGALDPAAAPRDAASRLVEALSMAPTLLVLDNCEHLVEATARLVEELLGRCPPLRILATSREALGIPGETLCPVPPLDIPESDATPEQALASPAVRLFADRAAAVRPDFTVTDANVRAVVEVCRRLDGLPLAIELAAARMRSLPIEHLAARLDDRFRLLTGGSRTALPRHRTLGAVVGWSWDLLEEREQRLAQRLAVFPATITPPAAAGVHGAATTVVEDTLATLVDKSLLQVVEGPRPRYRMLDTIRAYGLERLVEAGEIADARAAHARYFLELAERAEPHLRTVAQLPWIAELSEERDNLIAALYFACDAGDADTAVRLAAALGPLWTIQGHHAEAAGWLRRALNVPGQAPRDSRTVALVFYLLNTVLSGGRAPATSTTPPPDEVDTEAAHPAAALLEPVDALGRDDTVAGLAAIERRLDHPQPWTRGMLCLIRSFLRGNSGDLPAMGSDLAAAAGEFRQSGERWGTATALTYLGYVHTTLGEFDDGIAALREAISLLRQLDCGDAAVMQRAWIADARFRQGDIAQARAELLDIVAPGEPASSARYLIFARLALGDLARHEGDLPEAARQYQAAGADLSRVPDNAALFMAMLAAATAHLDLTVGDAVTARQRLAEALRLAAGSPDMPLVATIAVAIARLCLHDGADRAAEVLGAAHALRGAPDAFNPDVARLDRQLRDELGERAYQASYGRGRGLDRAGALALLHAQVRRR